MFAGTVITGGIVLSTVTIKEACELLLCASVAAQVTVVAPMGNVAPDAGVQLTGSDPSTRSIAVAVYVTTAPLALVAAVVILAGTVITGGVVSCTVTVKEACDLLLCESVALQVTVVVPSGKVEPDAGVQLGVIAVPVESTAVAV
jgi:hypothetical protein